MDSAKCSRSQLIIINLIFVGFTRDLALHVLLGLMHSGTKLTTVRIPKELYDVVLDEARGEDLGFNTVLNRILRRYVEWDKPAQGIGMISVPREVVIEILNSINESEFKKASADFSKSLEELAGFFDAADGKNLLGLLNGLCKYGGFGTLNSRNNGHQTTIHLRHGLGRKVSDLFSSFLKSFSKDFVELIEQENSITIMAKTRNKVKRK
ncbi:MAG: hypothetical protein V3U49_04040 [Nitrososphaerales archaeon]